MRAFLFACLPKTLIWRGLHRLLPALWLFSALSACQGPSLPPADSGEQNRLRVVTTVAPLRDIVAQVGGELIALEGLVPPGVNSHTFEPTPSDAAKVAKAQVVFVNGLQLEALVLALIEKGKGPDIDLVKLGDLVLAQSDWIFDFSFPESGGAPNPHLWMDPNLVIGYVEEIARTLAAADPVHANDYNDRAAAYISLLHKLDEAITSSVASIPPEQRLLLTYHDSWAYFARRYGFSVIGAIQPAEMSEPSAREVAEFIRQIRDNNVQVVFGSQEFPSSALQTIARETNVELIDNLADDVLPGDPGGPDHTYVGMMKRNVGIIVEALGGNAGSLMAIPSNP